MKLMHIALIGVAAILLIGLVTIRYFPTSNVAIDTNSIVPESKIVSGGVGKDGIPSIDNPKFITVSEATFLKDEDKVIGVNINGEAKAYPLSILVWHEIVNDEINGLPIAVTYCPLCFTSMVFERVIDDNIVEFGVSGKLYNNNLVMYDRTSDTLWSQGLGIGISGKYVGYELKKVQFDLASWKDWKNAYPNTLVLSQDTGAIRPYGVDPYGDYYTRDDILFPLDHRDDRLKPKELVYGIDNKAYLMDIFKDDNIINDSIDGKDIVIISINGLTRAFDRSIDGKTLEFILDDDTIKDRESNSVWNIEGNAIDGIMKGKKLERLVLEPSFWFSWVSFHKDTDIYGR
ncbi:MAG: hypothetical protein KatS3mg003_2218 [Candidatus Nitrosocaldaceae archaeon]|nr:MAG: hypothetical protein KatS3mg003_2180 [Candidatus Nitrosocaldaceae archaeon]GIU72739.1 MAG: hypothetical protein KatS3mg003_2218 [Candidatus Nitrosocaldaceae archaeon]